jgi:hypothetical protein
MNLDDNRAVDPAVFADCPGRLFQGIFYNDNNPGPDICIRFFENDYAYEHEGTIQALRINALIRIPTREQIVIHFGYDYENLPARTPRAHLLILFPALQASLPTWSYRRCLRISLRKRTPHFPRHNLGNIGTLPISNRPPTS